jgi:Fe-S-cluster containining protein/deoxycytidine triphosphate deaminase
MVNRDSKVLEEPGMLLSRQEILANINNGRLKIEPFNEDNLTKSGYMLTVEKVRIPKLTWTVRSGFIAISKLTSFQVKTRESICLSDGLVGKLSLSPVLCKKGVIATFPKIDSGYEGALDLRAFNSSGRTIDLASGDQFVEIVFMITSAFPSGRGEVMAPSPEVIAEEVDLGPTIVPKDPRAGGEPCQTYGCIECCLETEMPLSNDDVKRLEGLGYKNFYNNMDGWLILKNENGSCVFLNGTDCRVYQHRPEGCRFYPCVVSADGSGITMDRDCPHSGDFLLPEGIGRDLNELVDRIHREKRRRKAFRI